jgi:hypothetical protein
LAYGARRILLNRPGEELAAGATCFLAFAVMTAAFSLRPAVGLGTAGAALGHLFFAALVRRDFSFVGLAMSGSFLGGATAFVTTQDQAAAWLGAVGWGIGFCVLLPLIMRRRRPDQLIMAIADLPSEPLAILFQAGRILKIMARYSRRSRPQ